MTHLGHVKDGLIVVESLTPLPEGAIVKVELVEVIEDREAIDPLFRMAELAVDVGIPDLGVNLDHYLYGHPKVEDK